MPTCDLATLQNEQACRNGGTPSCTSCPPSFACECLPGFSGEICQFGSQAIALEDAGNAGLEESVSFEEETSFDESDSVFE